MKILRWVLAAAIVLAVLTGCSLFQGQVLVQNGSSYTVVAVYISATSESTFGDDLLATTINPGSSRVFEDICAGTYDLMALESGGGGWLKGDTVTGETVKVQMGKTYTWTLTDGTWLP